VTLDGEGVHVAEVIDDVDADVRLISQKFNLSSFMVRLLVESKYFQ
jgi:hypothetical protein